MTSKELITKVEDRIDTMKKKDVNINVKCSQFDALAVVIGAAAVATAVHCIVSFFDLSVRSLVGYLTYEIFDSRCAILYVSNLFIVAELIFLRASVSEECAKECSGINAKKKYLYYKRDLVVISLGKVGQKREPCAIGKLESEVKKGNKVERNAEESLALALTTEVVGDNYHEVCKVNKSVSDPSCSNGVRTAADEEYRIIYTEEYRVE